MGKWTDAYKFEQKLLNNQIGGVTNAHTIRALTPEREDDDRSIERRYIENMGGAAEGLLWKAPLAVSTEIARRKALLEQQGYEAARNKWYTNNGVQNAQQLVGKAGTGAPMVPFEQPAKVGLRAAFTDAVSNIPAMAKGVVKSLPGISATAAGLEGAAQGYITPTEEYAKRLGMPMPESTAGQVGLRAVGVMQDVGNAALMGLPKKHLW